MTLTLPSTLCSNCHLHSWTVFTRKIVNSEPKLTKIIQMHCCEWDKTSSLLWVSCSEKPYLSLLCQLEERRRERCFQAACQSGRWSSLGRWWILFRTPVQNTENQSRCLHAHIRTHEHPHSCRIKMQSKCCRFQFNRERTNLQPDLLAASFFECRIVRVHMCTRCVIGSLNWYGVQESEWLIFSVDPVNHIVLTTLPFLSGRALTTAWCWLWAYTSLSRTCAEQLRRPDEVPSDSG